MTTAKHEEPAAPVAWQGVVSTAPAKAGEEFTAKVPGFDDDHVFQIRRWESRGATIPAEGDEVLILVDDQSEPWVPAWWPTALEAEEESKFVVGPEGAEDGALAAFDGPTGKLIKEAGPITSEMIEAIEASKITGQIVETQIGPEAVTTPKLAAGSVTAAKIVAGTITAVQIAAETITASLIKAGTITSKEIAAETIKAANIAANTITASQIAAETITAAQIAANTITAGQIKASTITTKEIAANTIVAGNIAASTITSTEIAANTIKAEDIAAGTITANEIAAATITGGNIAGGTITGGEIASGTVTAGNITISKLSALSADLGTITAGTVTGATLRTAASGSRVVIDSEGLHAFNATETVLLFDIATGNLSLKGKVEAGSTIPASTVTGELTAAQIKEITAAKVAGKLTAAQIESIAATQVTGKLTNAQIEAIEAAKITGTITETQIGKEAISTAKLAAGAVTAAKITAGTITAKEIAAEAITTELLKADAVTSAKIAAATIVSGDIAAETIKGSNIAGTTIEAKHLVANTITAGQIAAGTITATEIKAATITGSLIAATTIETGNLKAEAVTAAKIAATTITAAKIAAETITGAKIAAGTIAAEKLNVSTLSAISADLGTITAGTVTGATIQTASANPKLILNSENFRLIDSEGNTPLQITKEGIALLAATAEPIPVTRKVSFLRPEGGTEAASIAAVQFSTSNSLRIKVESPDGKQSGSLIASANNTVASSGTGISAPGNALVEVTGGSGTTGQRKCVAGIVGVVEPKVLIDDAGRSDYVQYAGSLGTRRTIFGEGTFTFTASTKSAILKVEHKLGAKPSAILITNISTKGGDNNSAWIISGSVNETSFECQAFNATSGSFTIKFYWQAIG